MKKILSAVGAVFVLAGALFVASCSDGEYSDIKADTIVTLATPANLEITQSYGSILISWDAVADAAGYKVVRYDTTAGANDKTGTLVKANNYGYASTTSTLANGKTAKVYVIDNDYKTITNGTTYRYEVTALVNTNSGNEYAARTLYIKQGGTASKTVTAEVPETLDVAAALASGVEFSFDKDNGAVITLPVAAGLSYQYYLAPEDYVDYAVKHSGYIAIDVVDVFAGTKTYPATSASSTSNNKTISDNKVYQLFLAVRPKNTTKYGSVWTVVNTGLVAETYAATSSTTTVSLSSHNIVPDGKSKFLLVVRDYFADHDGPSNYEYTLKGYKYGTEETGIILETTPAITKTLTLDVIDDSGSTTYYGTEYTTDVIADGDFYLFVVERVRKSDSKETWDRVSTIVAGEDKTTKTDAELLADSYESLKNDLRFYLDDTTDLALNDAGAYTATATFKYEVGVDYTVEKIYRAKKNTYSYSYISSIASTSDVLESGFEEVTFAETDTTAAAEKAYHTEKTLVQTVTVAAADLDAASKDYYIYVLVVKDAAGTKHVRSVDNVYFY